MEGERGKYKVLILPELFPKDELDSVGIFVVDYAKSVLKYCTPQVFYSRLIGNHQQVKIEKFGNLFQVYRWSFKKSIILILKPIYYLFWVRKTLYQIDKNCSEIAIIHAHGTILNGTIAYLLSKKIGVPFIVTEHTNPFTKISNPFIKRSWAKFILNKADKVLAVSEHTKKEISVIGVEKSKITASYNPVDTDIFTLKQDDNKQVKNILFVSRLEPYKGGLRTLKAFHHILGVVPDWKLTICGEGIEKKAIVKYISDNKIEKIVTLKGTLTKKEYAVEIHQAAFLVFPSLHESFGLIPVEAMACGLPVITTNATAMPEYINKQNGILLDNANVQEISNAMLDMITNLLSYNTEKISAEIHERFGIHNFGKRLNDIYKEAINSQKA